MPLFATGRYPYDLSTAKADYPVWTGPPRRSILVCTHPRSGSTFLGEALYFTGALGCPLEYFHRGFRPFLAERWQAAEIHSYIEAVHRFRTDATGLLSVKLFWSDIEEIISELQPSLADELRNIPDHPDAMVASTYRRIRALLAGIFPNPTFIFLSRQDIIRQAISALVAMQTKCWRSFLGAGEQVPHEDVVYDFDRILSLMALSNHCNSAWSSFLLATGDSFHRIVYEDLVKDYETTWNGLCRYLGYTGPPPPHPRMRRQSNALSERMVLRFLKECCERGIGAV